MGSAVGTVLGANQAGGDQRTAREAADAMYQELLSIGMPPDLSKEIIFKEFQSQGRLTPEMEQYIELGPSSVANIQEDAGLKDAQMSALNLIKDRAAGGLTAEDRYALNQVNRDAERNAQARSASIIQNMQARGQAGSGAELLAQLQASQEASDRQSQAGLQQAALAAQNALQAASQSGSLASNIRTQDFDVNRTKASAEDEFKRFNVQNQLAQQQRNVAARNAAQENNLINDQRIADANIGLYNKEKLRQSDAQRQFWQDQVDRSKIRADAYGAKSKDFAGRAQQTINRSAAIGDAIGRGVAAFASGGMSEVGDMILNKVDYSSKKSDTSKP